MHREISFLFGLHGTLGRTSWESHQSHSLYRDEEFYILVSLIKDRIGSHHLHKTALVWDAQKEDEEFQVPNNGQLTMLVGFGALTGSPFALTGARVPAFSAARCSRWT